MGLPNTFLRSANDRFGDRNGPRHGYAHLANVSRVESPFSIAEHLVIRKATVQESLEIREVIEFEHPVKWRNPYETELCPPIRKGATTSHPAIDLPEKNWKYVVVGYEGMIGRLVHDLVDASYATPFPLELGFEISNLAGPPGHCVHGGLGRALSPIPLFEAEPALPRSNQQLRDLKICLERLATHDHALVDLRQPLEQFRHLHEVPSDSPLQLVGLFAIIESLLTHKPKDTDTIDSIGRQVRQKFILLNKRFAHPLKYDFFAGGDERKMWNQLYALRSAVAHGSTPDFKTTLRDLKGIRASVTFLRLAASALLRHALDEPQLIADLRQC